MKTTESSDAVSAPSMQVKPTAVISAPKRLAGRRHHAYRPVPTNDHEMTRPMTIPAPGSACGRRRAIKRGRGAAGDHGGERDRERARG